MDKSDIFVVALIVLACVFCGWGVIHFQKRANACEKLGGEMLKTAEGYVCAEIRRVK